MKSPFKFLDPYTLADKGDYFGRDKEIRQLYRQVLRTRLLLLYGLSGTGKTSLIQCGLAGEFNGPDWLPLWIRHQGNINQSLQTAIQAVLPTAEGSVNQQVRQLYQRFLRPVYLLFDQFEELFILGTPAEQNEFALTLKTILTEDLPCTVVLVMREEYLGRLYPLEKAIPSLFDFRLRVEPMDNANVKTFLRESFRKFTISVETLAGESNEARLDDIIQNVSQENSRIELPYLQVYLDRLYRQDFERTYPDQPDPVGQHWPEINLTKAEIEAFGTIDKVLDTFLDEQVQRIQKILSDGDPTTPTDAVKLVLDGFISDEGTKRPVRFRRQAEKITIDPSQQNFFPALAEKSLTRCLEELEKAKILRLESDTMEIAHDSLAQIIDSKRTAEQRERNNMKRQIRLAADTFSQTGEYLTQKQLAKFEDVFSELDVKEQNFFRESKTVREAEESAELEREKHRSAELEKALADAEVAKQLAQENEGKAKQSTNRARRWLVVAVAGLLIALAGGMYARQQQKQANNARVSADSARTSAEANLRQFQQSEFNAYLLDANTFLQSGDTTEVRTALDSARSIVTHFFRETDEARKMEAPIKQIEKKLNRK